MVSDWSKWPKPTGLASDSDREDVPLWMIDDDDLDADDFFDDEDEDESEDDLDVALNVSGGKFFETLIRDMRITFKALTLNTLDLDLEVSTEEFFVDNCAVRVTVRETVTRQRRLLLNREVTGVYGAYLNMAMCLRPSRMDVTTLCTSAFPGPLPGSSTTVIKVVS